MGGGGVGGGGGERVIKCKRVFIWQSTGTESSLAHIIGPNNGKLSAMQSDV